MAITLDGTNGITTPDLNATGEINADIISNEAGTGAPNFPNGLSVNSNPLPTAGPLSNRNKIINGAMVIDQRNAGAAVTPTGSAYLLDRWAASLSQASKLTFEQSTDAPVGFKNSLKITVASSFSPAAGDFFNIAQVVEGNNVADLEWGTADALTATVSFYAKVSVAGSYAVTVWSGNGDRNYTTDVALTTSWAKYSIVVAGLTSGTVDAGTGAALRVAFDFGSGSDFQTTAGSWQTGNYDINTTSSTKFVSQSSGATFYLTGVQLEVGDTATPFEHRPYGQELALCQRYFQPITHYVGTSQSATEYLASYRFSTPMRASPTVTLVNNTFGITSNAADFQTTNASINYTDTLLNPVGSGGRFRIAGFSGLPTPIYGMTGLAVANASNFGINASAEL
jgi:hypothetical protein